MSDRRPEILEKSAKLFHGRGYAATSVRDIAGAVGMKSASLYNHINTKQEILVDLLLPIAERYVSGIQAIDKAPLRAIEKLEKIIGDQIKITIGNIDAVSLIPDQWVHLDPKELKQFLSLRTQYESIFTEIFKQAIANGDLKSVHIEIASFSILSTLRRLYSWYAKHQGIDQALLEKELVINLLGGLRV